MFRRVLIANRGEIACRVAATLRRMGITSIAVFTDPDAGARHVRVADEAVAIGPPRAYLDLSSIIEAAREQVLRAVRASDFEVVELDCATAQGCAEEAARGRCDYVVITRLRPRGRRELEAPEVELDDVAGRAHAPPPSSTFGTRTNGSSVSGAISISR